MSHQIHLRRADHELLLARLLEMRENSLAETWATVISSSLIIDPDAVSDEARAVLFAAAGDRPDLAEKVLYKKAIEDGRIKRSYHGGPKTGVGTRPGVRMSAESRQQARQMREDGWTLQEIGDHFGVSRQRIHLILKKPPETG